MKFSELIKDYTAYQKALGKLSVVTLKHYCAKLRNVAAVMGENACLADLTTPALRKVCLEKAQTTPKTVRQFRCALIHFCNWLIAEGWLKENPALTIQVPKTSASRREPISDSMIEKMLAACDNMPTTAYRRRLVRAMLCTLAFAGLRKSEVVELKVNDADISQGCLKIWDAKGKKHRVVYPSPECIKAVSDFLAVRPADCTHDYLFALNKKYRMASNSVYRLIREVKTVAGFRNLKVTPHQFRHSFASRCANNGMPLPVLQAQLGHADLTTTAIYVHTDEAQQAKYAHLGSLRPGEKKQEAPVSPAVRPQETPQKPDRREAVSGSRFRRQDLRKPQPKAGSRRQSLRAAEPVQEPLRRRRTL